ncbi:MAG TPA: hypothetical protein VFM56_01820 [Solimonas sp.]|nr:hypothetical protein [Solimonas sp.]
MTAPSVPRTLLLTLLCVTLLAVRIGGAHLHFCFDGQEPAASMHVLDIDTHPDAGMDVEHHDYDVMLGDNSLAKSGTLGIELPVFLIAVIALMLLPRAQRRSRMPSSATLPRTAPPFLRPPGRAPPFPFSL